MYIHMDKRATANLSPERLRRCSGFREIQLVDPVGGITNGEAVNNPQLTAGPRRRVGVALEQLDEVADEAQSG